MGDQNTGHLSPEAVLREGGWNPVFARVLLIEEHDGHAVVLVDGNGDGAELELEYWVREDDGRWAGGSSSGHSGLGDLGRAETWADGTHVFALGKVGPGTRIRLSYAGKTYSREAGESGVWGFIAPADPRFPGELPIVAS
jgi:hypothetical protein